jgi:hypothetical protein
MIDLIAAIILFISFFGILVILFRKIPVLVNLPISEQIISQEPLFLRLKNKIKNFPFLKSWSFENFLQKLLSKIRILTLKTENKTANWLQKLRERSQKKKEIENDKYWEEIKKIKNEK